MNGLNSRLDILFKKKRQQTGRQIQRNCPQFHRGMETENKRGEMKERMRLHRRRLKRNDRENVNKQQFVWFLNS